MAFWKHVSVGAWSIAAASAWTSAARAETVDAGAGKPVDVDKSVPLKLALFIEIGTNSAVQSTIQGVRDMAAKNGFKFDVFDARFDVARQVNQMQTALGNGYNAWIVVPVEGSQVCDMVTKQAPARNVLVAQATGTACGRSSKEGADLWAPGTLTYVGGNEVPSAFEAAMLQANPDLTIIVGAYTNMSKGAVPALEAAVQALLDVREGKLVPHVILNDGHALIASQKAGHVGIVTSANVDGYVSESP